MCGTEAALVGALAATLIYLVGAALLVGLSKKEGS